jgi:hypothetical protein
MKNVVIITAKISSPLSHIKQSETVPVPSHFAAVTHRDITERNEHSGAWNA